MTLRRWRTATCWALVFLIAISPRALDAHAHLRRSAPASNEHLLKAPTELRLWFSELPQLSLTRVRLLGADGSEIPLGALSAAKEMSVVASIGRSLAMGEYVVVWQTAAADGHPSSGRIRFAVGSVPTPTAAAMDSAGARGDTGHVASSRDSAAGSDRGNAFFVPVRDSSAMVSGRGYVAARWLELVALLCTIGAIAYRFGVAGAVESIRAQPDDSAARSGVSDAVLRLLRPALVLLLLADLVRLGGEWQLVRERGMVDVSLRTLLGTSWGYGWIIGVAGAVIALVGAFFARRSVSGWAVAAAGVLLAAVSPAVTGHAIASRDHPMLAVTADVLHVLGGGAWVGTLLVIVLAVLPALRDVDSEGWGRRTAVLLTAFSPMALMGAGLVLASGLVSAWLRLGSVSALWRTPYGMLLVSKVALAALIAMLGAWNWRAVRPAVAAGESPLKVRRSASMELGVAAILLIVTAVLIALPTPV
jgi:copper transport protein